MKKITLVAISLIAFSFASCKKNYTCECTLLGVTTSVKSSTKISKSEAEKWCTSPCSLK